MGLWVIAMIGELRWIAIADRNKGPTPTCNSSRGEKYGAALTTAVLQPGCLRSQSDLGTAEEHQRFVVAAGLSRRMPGRQWPWSIAPRPIP
jgi:hypothetical protein